MPGKSSTFNQPVKGAASTVGEKTDALTQVKEKVADLVRTTADKIDENWDAAASRLDKASTALYEKAESLPGGENVTSLAHATAEKLSSTANYVRDRLFGPARLQ